MSACDGVEGGHTLRYPTSAIEDCLAGGISAEVAIARMLLACTPAATITAELDAAPSPDPRWTAMRALANGRQKALNDLADRVRHTRAQHSAAGATPEQGVAQIARFFDNAVLHSPEASVALYSLGDPAILAAATDEIIAWLPLPPHADVLDLGCGIGRIAGAVAPRCHSILGLDVSPGMIAEARRRHPALRFEQTGGQNLDLLADRSLDLIIAVDSFPYIVQTGSETVAAHLSGAARALRPGGMLVILNLSYRADLAQDRADAEAWQFHGFTLEIAGPRPFQLWDGTAFMLRRLS